MPVPTNLHVNLLLHQTGNALTAWNILFLKAMDAMATISKKKFPLKRRFTRVTWYSMTGLTSRVFYTNDDELAILRHVRSRASREFDDVADFTSFLHQWRWAFHLEDKRRCECSLSPARPNELELKDSSFLSLGSCNKGTEIYIITHAREILKGAHGILRYFSLVRKCLQIEGNQKLTI